MNTSLVNQIAMAALLTVLVVIGVNYLGDRLVAPKKLEKAAYPVAVEEEAAEAPAEEAVLTEEGGEVAPEAATEPAEETMAALPAEEVAVAALPGSTGVAALIASASPEAGAKVFKKCTACHTADADQQNRTGPALWNVIDRPVASLSSFNYSSAMAEHGGSWTYDALDAYLADPKTTIPGNKMTFAGLKKPADRANVIAFLRSKSDKPAPLP